MMHKFTMFAFALVKSKRKSPAFSGLVFAGFGRDELFPSLQSVEIDGLFFGELRIIKEQTADIDRKGDTAEIITFAQKDMPERFIFGIDKDLEDKLMSIAADMAHQVMEQAPDSFEQSKRDEIV